MEFTRKQTTNYQDKIIRSLEDAPDLRRVFTPFEDEVIRKYYPSKGGRAVAQAIGKNYRQIVDRANYLNVQRQHDHRG